MRPTDEQARQLERLYRENVSSGGEPKDGYDEGTRLGYAEGMWDALTVLGVRVDQSPMPGAPDGWTDLESVIAVRGCEGDDRAWGITTSDDFGNPLDRPMVYAFANDAERAGWMAAGPETGDMTRREADWTEVMPLTIAEIQGFADLSD